MKVQLDGLQMFAGGRACVLQSIGRGNQTSKLSTQEMPLPRDLKLKGTLGVPKEDKYCPAVVGERTWDSVPERQACKSLFHHLLSSDLALLL